ncbi:MAG: hypothetical protein JJ979_21040 [Roseibium sp.]|nr:hypothetical protein [Roseibium sp.]
MLLRLILLMTIVFSALTGLARAEPKEILVLTWRGPTPAEEGFMNELDMLGVEANFEFFDANRDQDKLAGFLRENLDRLKKKDLIYTFGTTTALTTRNFDFEGVPHIFNIVTDPVAVGLAASLDAPGHGSTGAKMSLPADVILELTEQIHPYDKIAFLFDPREPNAVSEVDQLTAIARARGKEAIQLRFTPDAAEKELQIAALAPQVHDVDIVFLTSTSSFIAHSHLLKEIIPHDKVSVSSSTAFMGEGVTVAFGTEYRERGVAAAKVAAKILKDNMHPNDVPIDEITTEDATIFINKDSPAASKLHLEDAKNPIKYK